MQNQISRRRFVTILASALPLIKAGEALAAGPAPVRWRGVAMGAHSQIVLMHEDEARARAALDAAVTEIFRLENLFSIYEPNSEVSRLNRDGYVEAPSVDLTRLLSEARTISEATAGAFDVTVQPLFEAYRMAGGEGPAAAALAQARKLADYRKLRITPARLAFALPGMALTLNGIAQGYISDRVSELLRRHGFVRTLVNLGEIKANGAGPNGGGWDTAIAEPGTDNGMLTRIKLTDRALATSAASGHFFGQDSRMHHLIEPGTGRPAGYYGSLSVLAPNATLADGLSTGLSMIAPNALAPITAGLNGVDVIARTASGAVIRI
jgi:FAD:protein FMN transferase